jgi:hypothetical protein
MSKTSVTIDPVTRIEGHLAVRVEVEDGRVREAFSAGEMFRGFEILVKGRSPLDAQQITQRICGVCPVSHGLASSLAQDAAYGVEPPENGLMGRNLIQAANFIQSHIIHFYQLSALDFIDVAAAAEYRGGDPALNELKAWVNARMSSKVLYPAAPFPPRYAGGYVQNTDLNLTVLKHYLDALEMRALAHRMGAVFAGKLPHAPGLVPGGVTERITAGKIAAFESMLSKPRTFIDRSYLPDVLATAAAFPGYLAEGKGRGNFLAFGAFPESASGESPLFPSGVLTDGVLTDLDIEKITEDTGRAFYDSPSGLPPAEGQTVPGHDKPDAYSWVKAPRYGGEAMEVGPLARIMIAYFRKTDGPLRILTRYLSVLFHSTLSTATGEVGMEIVRNRTDAGGYCLIAEGSVPRGMPSACKMGGDYFTGGLLQAAANADSIIAAGEAGKNFEIVAGEIRRLADNTMTSTRAIKERIDEVQSASDNLIVVSREGTQKITEGWKLSKNLDAVFQEVLDSSETSADSAQKISESINQQAEAFEQILLTLKQISDGIDNFVVSTEATTQASETLRVMADDLKGIVGKYAV